MERLQEPASTPFEEIGLASSGNSNADNPSTSQRPGARRRRAKEEAIIRVAGRLFAQNGFSKTSFGEIAESIDLTPKALYYYFASKRDLLDAVLDRAFHYFNENALSDARERWVGLSVEDALLESSLEAVKAVLDHGDLLRVSFSETFRGSETTRRKHEQYMTNWTRHVAIIVDHHGMLDRESATEFADHLVSILFGTAVDVVLRPRPTVVSQGEPVRAHFDRIVSHLIQGIVSAPIEEGHTSDR